MALFVLLWDLTQGSYTQGTGTTADGKAITWTVNAGGALELQGNAQVNNLTLVGGAATFNNKVDNAPIALNTLTVTAAANNSALTGNYSQATGSTWTVTTGAALDIGGAPTIDDLVITAGTVNFTATGAQLAKLNNITIKQTSSTEKSYITGSCSQVSGGTWLVDAGLLQVPDLTGAKYFGFTAGNLIVNGNADFNAAGEFGISSKPSAEIVIARDATVGDSERTVTIGKIAIHTGQIIPDTDGEHTVIMKGAPATPVQLGTAANKFKLINIAAPVSIDASLMNAQALTIDDSLTITANAFSIPTTINNGASLSITSPATLTADVTAGTANDGTLEIIGNGTSSAAVTLPTIGSSASKLGALNLGSSNVDIGVGNIYVQNLVMDDSQLNLGTHAVSVSTVDIRDNNTITTTVENNGASYGSLNIVDGIHLADGATLKFVVRSSSHIPSNTVLNVLSGNLNGLLVSTVTSPDQGGIDSARWGSIKGQVIFKSDMPLSTILPNPSGNITVITDQGILDEVVNTSSSATPGSANPIGSLVGIVDISPFSAEIVAQIKQAFEQGLEAGRDITSSFTDGIDSAALTDQGLASELNDPVERTKLDTSLISSVVSSGDKNSRSHLWTKVLAGGATQLPDNNMPSYKQSIRGIMVGVDHDFSDRLNLGLAVNLGKSTFDYTNVKKGDSLNAGTIGLYGFSKYQFNDKISLTSILSYHLNTIKTTHIRVINPNEDATATAQHASRSYGGIARLGYKAQLNSIYSLTPTIGLMHNYTKDDAYTETGAGKWNFIVDASSRNRTTLVAGVSLAADHETWKPEIHFNVYQSLNENKGKNSFGFGWMPEGMRFSNEGPKLPTTQVNVGFNLGIYPADGVYTELVGELNVARNHISYQGALSVKVDF